MSDEENPCFAYLFLATELLEAGWGIRMGRAEGREKASSKATPLIFKASVEGS